MVGLHVYDLSVPSVRVGYKINFRKDTTYSKQLTIITKAVKTVLINQKQKKHGKHEDHQQKYQDSA